jgi:predicted O-methyltransferase YrrM
VVCRRSGNANQSDRSFRGLPGADRGRGNRGTSAAALERNGLEASLRIVDSKAVRLISVLMKDPVEFLDRARVIAGGRLSRLTSRQASYAISDGRSAAARLGDALGSDLGAGLSGGELADAEFRLHRRMESLPADTPFGTFHNGDLALARLCYAVTRALGPEIILETGVCYGITSAFILEALERNRKGSLHSVDLPPLGRDDNKFVGWAVPDGPLKSRWHLHRGASRKLLPRLLKQVGRVDVFVHDSLHTYRNMRMEFELVWPRLRPGGVLISDDIQGNAAFLELAERKDVAFHAAVQELEKDSLLGVLVKRA